MCCVTVLGVKPGHSGDLRVSNSLIGVIDASLHVLVALLCLTYGTFHVACLFYGLHPPPLYILLMSLYS